MVAIIAAYKAVKSGYQMAIMAPTSILAAQHLESFSSILDKFGIRCELLISNMTAKKKREVIEDIENGKIDVVIRNTFNFARQCKLQKFRFSYYRRTT